MKKKKLITAAIASFVLVSSFTAGAYAATKFKLIVDGKTTSADIQEIKGAPYVALKDVGNLLGATVKYDSKTKTATITSKGSATTAPSTNDTGQSSRTKPAAIGSTQSFTVDSALKKYTGQVSITQIIRGDEAWKMISEANSLNSPAKDGYEYILAKANVKIISNKKSTDAAVDVWNGDFKLVSSSGTDYDYLMSIVLPEPNIDAKVYAGSSKEGWVAFQVKKDDPSPVISFARKYDGSGGVWFKTN
ncbi:hypothetical protein [Paenibacillus riograndensis]|uniref:Copper amine oxidase-like N-terminal domain-containing protein n=1 Tax=Paenibacillus riograndensis SBR5 TaxID=1073571 RepID=A0A0E4H9X1_9BACL|nr:hypothetical protein [Paenibacillus riograndensis]CQR51494.1 hypothetical protein PRIO_0240 [Paenibacillus riograndensis SBR5]